MLTLKHYEDRLERLETQFEFMRYSVETMSGACQDRFFRSKRDKKIGTLEAGVGLWGKEVDYDEKIKEVVLKSGRKKWNAEFGKSNQYFHKQFTLDDLNRSELLLLVAHLEWCFKEIHRQLILADPRKPFAKTSSSKSETSPGGSVPVWEIFQSGYENFLSSTFFTKLVEKEVGRVDRLAWKARFEYFDKYFKLGFRKPNESDDATIAALESLSGLRNRISHEIMNPNAVTHVSAPELQKARTVCRDVPRKLAGLARDKYPKHFK